MFMTNKKNTAILGWRLFALSWIPFIGIFSYAFYPVEEWLPPISIYCLIISMCMMISGVVLILVSLPSGVGDHRRIRQTGERGQATILSVEDSGTRINNHFVLNVGVRIAPAFGPAFEAVCSQVIPIYHMAKIQKNNTVNVLYLKDTQEAVIDFE